jgi:NAD(P)-dependent dehydrogenase (short-subunit alcohol dehydrogenase family)
MNFENKVVIITGASSGIGQELAFQLARKKAKVVLAARNAELIQKHAAQIQAEGGTALAIPTDVSRRFQVEMLVQRTVAELGGLDVLINNAGVSPAKGTILENTEEDVRKTMEINFMGSLYGVWAAAPHMEKAGGGQIVFVSSIIGKRGIPFNAAYCASKFAIQGLTESIRPELAPKNIRVITICPPGVDTPFYENNGKPVNREYRLHSAAKIARMIVEACEKEKRELLPTIDAKVLHVLNFFAPAMLDRAVAKVKGVKK